MFVDNSMEPNSQATGAFEVRYLAFLETVVQIRPRLHRYCSRMTGSALDGEDVVQDALFEAYRKLDQYDDSRSLSPWLFRIAHNRCIDFLRRQQVRDRAETSNAVADFMPSKEPAFLGVRPALEHLVLTLPPKERACVLLKDVFDYSLEETAELVNSTVGGVKAALNRARMKLASSPALPRSLRKANRDPEATRVMQLYVDRFNRRDWDGVRELISADATLRVADAFAGRLSDSPYFGNYDRWSMPWKMSLGEVDGELAVIVLQRGVDTWTPTGVARLMLDGRQIRRVVDYVHCPWVIPTATSLTLATARR